MKKYENLNLIICVGKDNIMGDKNPIGNGLLWNSREELLYFKEKTLGHTLLFGENTAKVVPLNLMRKDREVIVLNYDVNIDELLDKLEKEKKQVFICGGHSIYTFFLQNYIINKLYISILKEHVQIKEAKNPLYLPDVEDLGYTIKESKEYTDFIAYIYEKN